MGVTDGTNASQQTKQDTEDLLHFFSLKKKQDSRVRGIKYDDFLTMKMEGVFEQHYNVQEDAHLKALFLQ